MLKLPPIFSDRMILQREKPVAVWGEAAPGAQITVSVQGVSAAAAADEAGRWRVTLAPLTASFAETLTVSDGTDTLTIDDVQVGEVWLAGGQSNMEFHMRYDADMAAEQDTVCENVRYFDYPEVSYVGQIDEADYRSRYAFWRKAIGKENIERFSGPGYYFAKKLNRDLGVPVGVIGCNWGGTPACAWMSEESIKAGGGQAWLDEYAEAAKGLDLDEYNKTFAANPANYQTDLLGSPMLDLIMFGVPFDQMGAKMKELGIEPPKRGGGMMPPAMGPRNPNRPSGLYESMLKQLVPYSIRGFLWYQGETDGDRHPDLYKTLFPALIADWRQLWGEELPFLFAQIAPLDRWGMCDGTPYAIIREAQQHTADTVPLTGMAVTGDVGMKSDIHPKKKKPVGERFALLAEHIAYGKDLLCEAPTLVEAIPAEGSLTLRFANAGEGLHLEYVTPYGEELPAGVFSGVTVIQDGVELDAAALEAKAAGDTVTLTGDVLRDVPTSVQIGRGGWYQINLYNSAGIPARPAAL